MLKPNREAHKPQHGQRNHSWALAASDGGRRKILVSAALTEQTAENVKGLRVEHRAAKAALRSAEECWLVRHRGGGVQVAGEEVSLSHTHTHTLHQAFTATITASSHRDVIIPDVRVESGY